MKDERDKLKHLRKKGLVNFNNKHAGASEYRRRNKWGKKYE